MKRVVWVVLVLAILALVYFRNYRAKLLLADPSIGIKLEQYPTSHNLTILQGESKTTKMFMENLRDERLFFIKLYYEKPSGINITEDSEYTTLEPNSSTPVLLKFTVGEDVENETHKINVWAQSAPDANDEYSISEKYPIYVTVLYNPSIIRPTTTTTIANTTTTTTLPEQEIKGILLKKENLAILVVVVLIALMVIPYLTFKESPENSGKSSQKSKNETTLFQYKCRINWNKLTSFFSVTSLVLSSGRVF